MTEKSAIENLFSGQAVLECFGKGRILEGVRMMEQSLVDASLETITAVIDDMYRIEPDVRVDRQRFIDYLRQGYTWERMKSFMDVDDPRVRDAALAYTVGRATPEELRSILHLAKDPDEHRRGLFAGYLQNRLFREDATRRELAKKFLESGHPAEIKTGLTIVASFDLEDLAYLPLFLGFLLHEEKEIRERAMTHIDEMVGYSEDETGRFDSITDFLVEHRAQLDERVLQIVTKLRPSEKARTLYPALFPMLRSSESWIRARASDCLESNGLLDEKIGHELIDRADDSSLRYRGFKVLLKAPTPDVDVVKRALRDQSRDVVELALDVLESQEKPVLVDELVEKTRDADKAIRTRATKIAKKWKVKLKPNPMARFKNKPIVDVDAFVTALKKTPLKAAVEAIAPRIRPAFAVSLAKAADSDLEVGASKFGGMPDLLPDDEWPVAESGPMAFVAQINLTELGAAAAKTGLPATGLLLFFVDFENCNDVPGSGKEKVIHRPELKDLRRAGPPKDLAKDRVFESKRAALTSIYSLPSTNSALHHELGDLYDAYQTLCDDLGTFNFGRSHQVLGNAELIQSDFMEDPSTVMLLQVDSDGEMMWGDSGMLYYLIKSDDLRAGNFDAVYMEMQCT